MPAFGHGITETRENIIVPISSGAIVKAYIQNITKGQPKSPGDIKGTIYKEVFGHIYTNTVNGIYGKIVDDKYFASIATKDIISASSKYEVKEGEAYLYCTLMDNKVQKYKIQIEKVLINSGDNKSMIIKVVDETLLNITGGIVQGMSGSPIVQNGKLVGAVTYVFLNDPTRGYAVFAENMIYDMQNME